MTKHVIRVMQVATLLARVAIDNLSGPRDLPRPCDFTVCGRPNTTIRVARWGGGVPGLVEKPLIAELPFSSGAVHNS